MSVIARYSVRIDPYTGSSQTRLETLHSNNGKQKPEKANQEGHVDKQRCCFLQTSEYNGCSTSQPKKTESTEATQHAKDVDVVAVLIVNSSQRKRDPEGYHGDKVKSIERMPQKGPARKTIPLLLAAMAWLISVVVHVHRGSH